MTPPRKRQNLEDIKLIPEKDFEDVMRAVLRGPSERVSEEEEKKPNRSAVRKRRVK